MEAIKSVPATTRMGAECLGSFLVVFVVCSNYSAGQADGALAVFGPTSIACVYMAMSYALKGVSGGILNPAVTLALMLQQAIDKVEGVKMMAAQAAGGAAAGFATLFLYGWTPAANIIQPHSDSFLVGAPLVEALYTCLLCFVYLNVNLYQSKSYYGLAVGFVFIAGGVGGRYVSGAAFNPAVSLGVNFMGTNWKVVILPIYLAAQFLGAILAVVLYNIVRKDQLKQDDGELSEREAQTKGYLIKAIQAVTAKLDPEDSCEFIGTLFISLTISLNQIAQSDAQAVHDAHNIGAAAGKVWSSAACLISVMYALSDISGGLFNPALTLAYAVRFFNTGDGLDDNGRCSKIVGEPGRICDWKLASKETLKYMVFQLFGGAAGTGLTILVWSASGTWPVAPIQPGFTENNAHQYTVWQAMFAEFYGTFLMCFTMVVVMLSKNAVPDFGPFVVGGSLIAAGYAFGPLSGGFFNPAIVLGNAVGSKFQVLYTMPPGLYVLGQLLGGVLAGAVFRLFTHKQELQPSAEGLQQNLLPVLP